MIEQCLQFQDFLRSCFLVNSIHFLEGTSAAEQTSILIISNIVWGLMSMFWVEWVRDTFHWLAHHWPWLARHHSVHHRVFNRDMSPVSRALYQNSQWHHDVPESVVMLLAAILFLFFAFHRAHFLGTWGGSLLGLFYTIKSLCIAIFRGLGYSWAIDTDVNHQAPLSPVPPSNWFVNWSYHQRHHFDNPKAYYSGAFTLVDKLIGKSLSLKGKKIAVTGASGALGQALLKHLRQEGAKVYALTSSQSAATSIEINGQHQVVETISWAVGEENALIDVFASMDIVVLNHGVNLRDRTETGAINSFEVNTLSTYRLLERFLAKVRTPFDSVRKEVWIVTSEAEIAPAHSPLYEMSKRMLGNLVTLKRLDSPCVLRKLVLGDFRSRMSPKGRLSADWVARMVIQLAKRDIRNIIVSPWRPWIYIAYPVHEWLTAQYYKRWSYFISEPMNTPSEIPSGT